MWIAVVRLRRAFCCSRWQCWEQELGCREVAAVSTGRVLGATCWRAFELLSVLVHAVVFTGHLMLPRSRYSIEDLRLGAKSRHCALLAWSGHGMMGEDNFYLNSTAPLSLCSLCLSPTLYNLSKTPDACNLLAAAVPLARNTTTPTPNPPHQWKPWTAA